MNELQSSTESGKDPDAPSTSAPPAVAPPPSDNVREQNRRLKFLAIGLLLLTALLLGQWWSSHVQVKKLREEIARRLQAGDSSNTETKVIAKAVQDDMKELQAKVGMLESKQAETQSQQVSLAQLYQDLSRNRDDWALAEIEQVLSTANQQLQLSGNVQGALIALQNADRTLSRSDKPQFIVIRRALAKDIEKLRAFPVPDVTGAALKIDSVIAQIPTLPLLSGEKLPAAASAKEAEPVRRPADETPAQVGKSEPASFWAGLAAKWNAWTEDMWSEMKTLIRVRNVDAPDALMLSPNQAFFLRENLELRLLSARMSLLSRNDATFRNDMQAAKTIIGRYFDPNAKQTQAVLAILKQVEAGNISIEMPTLAESLTAVQNYRAKP